MLLRLVRESLWRRRGRVTIAILAVLVGAAVTSSLISVSMNITEQVGRELTSFGANIIVTPNSTSIPIEIGGINFGSVQQQQFINESDLPKLKTIFWRNQITAFAPYLYGLVQSGPDTIILTGTWFSKQIEVPGASITLPNGTITKRAGQTFVTGVKDIAPWWKIQGELPKDEGYTQSLVGASIAKRLGLELGDTFRISYQGSAYTLQVAGIVNTGSFEDDQVFVTLDNAQRILGKPDDVDKVLVSALIKPDDELANKDHKSMTQDEMVRWYCSPYIGVFTYQIEEAILGVNAVPIRHVAETEGKLLAQNQFLFTLIAINSISVSAIAVTSTMMASVQQRRREIGLMKAIGADSLQLASQFVCEAFIIALLGGILGFPTGYLLASFVSSNVFGSSMALDLLILPITLLVAVGIALFGSLIPLRRAVAVDAAAVLRGE